MPTEVATPPAAAPAPQLPTNDTAPQQDVFKTVPLAERMRQFNESVAQKEAPPEKPAEKAREGGDAPPETPPAEKAPVVEKPEKPTKKEAPPVTEVERAKYGELKQKATERDELVEKKLPALEKELAELRAKAEQAVDTSRFDQEIKAKQAQIDAYEKKVAVFDVRESKQFQADVLEPMAKIGSKVDRMAATYKVSPQALKDALTIADPAEQLAKLTELTTDFNDMHKAQLWNLVEETQSIYEKAAQIEANAQEAKKEIEWLKSQEEKKTKEETQRLLSAASAAVQKNFREALPDIFPDDAAAQQLFDGIEVDPADPGTKAFNAHAGKILLKVVPELRAKEKRIKELEKELAERASVSVKAGGGAGQQQNQPESNGIYQGGSTWDRAKAAAAAGKLQLG